MNILVINSGSSTVKFQVIETNEAGGELRRQKKLARGLVDRIGGGASYRFETQGGATTSESAQVKDHEEAVRLIINWLRSNMTERTLDAVGHRVVHGGAEFASPVLIDDAVLDRIAALSELAPLHNPAAVNGIRAALSILGPAVTMVAAFDTSFHRTIPENAALYAIPHELSEKHAIKRYGFHGLAHQYSMLRYGELVGVPPDDINIVTLHLGNGCSATAIRRGESIETSMGFTPLEGLVMGTRSGDLDPALVSYLAERENVGADEIENWLNTRSGLLGLSGISSDMRELTSAYDHTPRARLAVDVFCHRARKYLGAYLAVLGGAKAVVFSGGIGENSPLVREKICREMQWCGIKLDETINGADSDHDRCISSADSSVKIYVLHTDEESIIARDTARIAERRG